MSSADAWLELDKTLTKAQRRVIKWLAETGKEPYDACRDGVISHSMMTRWTSAKVRKWVEVYQAAFPDPQAAAIRVRAELLRAVPDATRVIVTAVHPDTVKIDATKVRTAQWVIEVCFTDAKSASASQPPSNVAQNGVEQLAAVLKLVK